MSQFDFHRGKQQLADDLELLVKSRPVNKRELFDWYAQARMVHDGIRTDRYVCDVPHFIIHFLIDADTRLKDSKYAQVQEEMVMDFIARLREQ